jgi:hypothetical protein
MSGWPDPDKPGMPTNPEQDGYHWLFNPDDDRPHPVIWVADLGAWAVGDVWTPRMVAEMGLHYQGPCLKPAEVDTLRAENARLRGALADMHAGWRYIRLHYGDLSGVGWERCDAAARAALEVKP